MSLYFKETPEFFDNAMTSIWCDQKNKPNENVSEQQKETKTPQKKARKTKGTQPKKLRPDTDRVSDET